MRAAILFILLLALTAASGPSDGPGYVVIVHPKNPASQLAKKFVADAFLKKQTQWGDDLTIKPVDQPRSSTVRAKFSTSILGRPVSAVRTYWNQVVFSGRGLPPPELESDAQVVKFVSSNRAAIGYVAPGTDLSGVKVVHIR